MIELRGVRGRRSEEMRYEEMESEYDRRHEGKDDRRNGERLKDEES